MTTFISNRTSLVLAAATPASSGFGSGSDAGTFVDNVWTPGRDAAGLVNAASWATVPAGRWVRVGGSQMSALDAAIKSALPGWRDFGNWFQLVNESWGGLCVDQSSGTRMWWSGGGHGASSNNGLYRFDAFKMKWAVECLPTNPTGAPAWPTGYQGQGALYQAETLAQYDANPPPNYPYTNSVGIDEWQDGKPIARHTYNGMVYAPNLNRIFMSARRFWSYNLASGKWDYKRIENDVITRLDLERQGGHYDQEHKLGIWDEATNEYLCGSYGSFGVPSSFKLNWNSKNWGAWQIPMQSADYADARHGRDITMVGAGYAGGNVGTKAPPYVRYNLDSRTTTASGNVRFEGMTVADLCAPQGSQNYDAPCLCYIPPLRKYWFIQLTSFSSYTSRIFEIDPSTTPWTMRPLVQTGAQMSIHWVIGRKMAYLSALNAVMFINDGDSMMYLHKL